MAGERLASLSVDDLQYFEAQFFLIPGTGTVYVNADLSVIRKRAVGHGFHEQLTILNHRATPVDLTVRVDAASDFADLFEVKDALTKKGVSKAIVEDERLVLRYERPPFVRETWISSSEPATIDSNGFGFDITIGAHDQWSTDFSVVTRLAAVAERHTRPKHGPHERGGPGSMVSDLEAWVGKAPTLSCDWEPLTDAYRRSLIDLAALRFHTLTMPGRALPAAGLPWFMTLFGRDSIFTSLQALPFVPELAATTLLALGERQGTRTDDFRDEDPGRILHEMRYGELTAFEERPHSPYYGSADATPLRGAPRRVRALDRRRRAGPPPRVRGARCRPLDRRVRRPPRQRLRVGRLPEAFGGYDRLFTRHPVQYPTACSPQAWSTGTPLLLLRTMLGLEPIGDRLLVDPALPKTIGRLELLDIPGRWGRIDAFGRGRYGT